MCLFFHQNIFHENHEVSTPTVQTNTVTALPLMASLIGEVVRSFQAFHISLTFLFLKKKTNLSESFTNVTNVL